MKKFIASLLVSSLTLASGVVHAAAKISPAVADELLQKSGLITQLEQLGPSIEGGLNLNPAVAGKITEAQLESVRKAFATTYATDRLKAEAKTQIAAALSPEFAKQTLVWLDSDLGKRITKLEDDASQGEGFEEREAASIEIFKRLPQRRTERYTQLAKATKVGEGAASVAINTTLATARGVSAAASDTPDRNIGAIKARLDEDRPKLAASFDEQFLVLFSGAYQTLEDKEIDQYIAFAESPAGVAYHSAVIKVFDAVMTRATADACELVAASRKAGGKTGA